MYAKRIREAILLRHPDAEIRGYGDYGFDIGDLAVIGFVPVLKKLFYFLRVRRTILRAIDDWRPDVVCTIDYPGMNLRIAAAAKSRGVRTVHVVCPQVWAWHQNRIPKIEAALDRLCCFFPFEPKIFREGFAEFVGHPLLDEMSREKPAPVAKSAKVLAVLPGSRMGEIDRNLPTLLEVIACLAARHGAGLKFIIPAASPAARDRILSIMHSYRTKVVLLNVQPGAVIEGAVETRLGGARDVLRCADAAVVASGTATLEAAIVNCPTVLVYRVGWLFAAIMRRLIKGVKHVGLANIIAEKAGAPCPMPELLQEDFTWDNVLKLLMPLLEDAEANARARRALADTMRLLQSDGAAIDKIARRVCDD